MAWKSFIGSWDKMKLSRTDAIRIVVLEASCFEVALEAIIPVNRVTAASRLLRRSNQQAG
jgi:hypothetical protein